MLSDFIIVMLLRMCTYPPGPFYIFRAPPSFHTSDSKRAQKNNLWNFFIVCKRLYASTHYILRLGVCVCVCIYIYCTLYIVDSNILRFIITELFRRTLLSSRTCRFPVDGYLRSGNFPSSDFGSLSLSLSTCIYILYIRNIIDTYNSCNNVLYIYGLLEVV